MRYNQIDVATAGQPAVVTVDVVTVVCHKEISRAVHFRFCQPSFPFPWDVLPQQSFHPHNNKIKRVLIIGCLRPIIKKMLEARDQFPNFQSFSPLQTDWFRRSLVQSMSTSLRLQLD